jgi:hypothetical protein
MVHVTLGVRPLLRKPGTRIPTIAWTMDQKLGLKG